MTAEIVILLMGVYLIGGGLMMTLSPERLVAMFESIETQPGLTYIAGAIMAPTGAAILYWFHDFSSWPSGLSTLIGAGLLIEGWLLMAAPKLLFKLAKVFMFDDSINRVLGVAVLVLGAAAIWFGVSG